jgi:hypothetical protein
MPADGQNGQGIRTKGGLLRVLNNAQLDAEEALKAAEKRAAAAMIQQDDDRVRGLFRHVQSAWVRNRDHREQAGINDRLLSALRQRNSEYDAEKASAIEEQGGTDVFMGLTALKCRAGEAWLLDILGSNPEKPWFLTPTPIPDLPQAVEQQIVEEVLFQLQEHVQAGGEPVPPQAVFEYAARLRDEIEERVQDEAKLRATRMERKIYDQQVEGKWDKAFSEFITNVITFPAAFIKGPVIRRRKRLTYPQQGGKTTVRVRQELVMEFEAPSPFDMYPSPSAVDINDGDLCRRDRYTPGALRKMKGVQGWDSEAIDLCIKEYGRGGLRSWTSIDQERSELEDHGTDLLAHRDDMEVIEFWGKVLGEQLILDGVTTTPDGGSIDPLEEYEICAFMIGNYLVYRDFNPDPLGNRPYSKSSWAKIPGSYWGKGVPALMDDLQAICNATIRSLVNNEAIGSGPQVVFNDVSRLPAGEEITSLIPWGVWQFTNPYPNNPTKPMDFYQPEVKAGELLHVYQAFANMADDFTGIPSYAHGNDNVKGAGRTMGGLSMLMTNAARGMKMVIGRLDLEVLEDVIRRQFIWNMLYDPDESIKGDVQINPRGALALIMQEQLMSRRMEYLNVTNNPTDQMVTGLEGRRIAIAETAKSLDLPKDAVRSEEEVEQTEQALMAAQAAGAAAGGPVQNAA